MRTRRASHRGVTWGGVAAIAVTTIVAVPFSTARAGVPPSEGFCAEVPVGVPGDLAVVNLTPVDATGPGTGQLVSSDLALGLPPVASNVNFDVGSVDPNVAVAVIGADRAVCFDSAVSEVDIVIDLLATLRAGTFTRTSAPFGGPLRLVDTRDGMNGTRLAAGQRLCFPTGAAPGSLAVINLTPVFASQPGFGVLTSSSQTTRPSASNVNFRPGTVDPNLGVAAVGPDGAVCFWNSELGPVDLIADLLVTLAPGSFSLPLSTGPLRVLDTRGGGSGPVAPGARRCFTTDGAPGSLAVVNLTPVGATGPGNGALIASDNPGPVRASNVNFAVGTVDPNVAVTAVGADRGVCFANGGPGTVDVVADLLAIIPATSTVPPAGRTQLPLRLGDTRSDAPRLIACAGGEICFGATTQLFRSTDRGTHWTVSRTALPLDFTVDGFRCQSTVVCVADGQIGTVTGLLGRQQRGGLVTVDGGLSWRSPAEVAVVHDIACPLTFICIAVGETGTPLFQLSGRQPRAAITVDGGRIWRDIPLPESTDRLDRISCSSFDTCRSPSREVSVDGTVVDLLLEFSTSDEFWTTVTVTQRPI